MISFGGVLVKAYAVWYWIRLKHLWSVRVERYRFGGTINVHRQIGYGRI
jgi:hypothetical protein